MKTCPNCGEILGDSVNVCFKCRYDFFKRRVITGDKFSEQRDQQIKEQNRKFEEAKLKEEQKEIQLSKNPLFEYEVVNIHDLPTGESDDENIQKALNIRSQQGWRLHTIYTNEIGKNSIVGINATINQTILIFERCIKA
ncbi:MAG: DUF4177 domain-containing protein [Lachnospiraceae bacterium]|nr:DUF4177 domain-containing protein [Lachnospiraceae bacterium]